MNQKNKSYTVDEIKLLLEKYCIYQDRCHFDVEKKMNDYTNVLEVKEHVLLHLIEHNFLNEERFAKSFVRGKFNQKKWGRNKIKFQLNSKNISKYNIDLALKEIDNDKYLVVLEEQLEKKHHFVKENNPFLKKKKVINYLVNKGFEFELINSTYNKLFNF